MQLMTRTNLYKFSFFPSVIKLWNSLPPYVANSTFLDNFCNNSIIPVHYNLCDFCTDNNNNNPLS